MWNAVSLRLDAHIASLSTHLDLTGFEAAVAAHLPNLSGSGSSSSNSASAATISGGACGVGGLMLNHRAYNLIRPHAVARRYAELAASLHSIGHAYPGSKYHFFESI
ncbi:unnamed protein product [Protopolystoma xenopodis]|uniref:Uncharacterized protein n=1 Tax=Protopolystoma xenopodis TaxID=117903 RepID=A0A448WMR9_9PLAT|nr:unnamed protein product [Protopolystoma xenopodis]